MGRSTHPKETLWPPPIGNSWAGEEDSMLVLAGAGLKKLRGLKGENIKFKCRKLTEDEYSTRCWGGRGRSLPSGGLSLEGR